MSDLIDKEKLYQKAYDLEAEAFKILKNLSPKTNAMEWQKWNIILTERTLFKFDIADAPSVESEIKNAQWIQIKEEQKYYCSECGYLEGLFYPPMLNNYCPNCGARMSEEIKQ